MVDILFKILCLFLLFFVPKFWTYYARNTVREKVVECLGDWNGFGMIGLINRILSSENQTIYLIKNEENEYANIIFENFKNNLVYSCVNNEFPIDRKHLKLTDKEFCILELLRFLEKHECDHYFFSDYKMYKVISQENYGSWGSQLYDKDCLLTDFGFVYYKILYATMLFFEKNEKFSKNGWKVYSED